MVETVLVQGIPETIQPAGLGETAGKEEKAIRVAAFTGSSKENLIRIDAPRQAVSIQNNKTHHAHSAYTVG